MKNKIEIIEIIMQHKISKYIKENKDMDAKELAKTIDNMLNQKEELIKMDEAQLEEELRKIKQEQ